MPWMTRKDPWHTLYCSSHLPNEGIEVISSRKIKKKRVYLEDPLAQLQPKQVTFPVAFFFRVLAFDLALFSL